jgi:hypothetical protein
MSRRPSLGSDAVVAVLPPVEVVSGHPTDDELVALRYAFAERAHVAEKAAAAHARRASAARGVSGRYSAPGSWAPAERDWVSR